MFMKVIKKNQIIIFVGALMLIVAGYLNFSSDGTINNLIPTSTLADSEEMASIGDAKLVSANVVESNTENDIVNNENIETIENSNELNNENEIDDITKETLRDVAAGETQETSNNASQNVADNYFTQSRLDRDTMYSQSLDTYQKIIDNTNISEDQKAIAQEEISKINEQKNSIMIAENLIKVKGLVSRINFLLRDKAFCV